MSHPCFCNTVCSKPHVSRPAVTLHCCWETLGIELMFVPKEYLSIRSLSLFKNFGTRKRILWLYLSLSLESLGYVKLLATAICFVIPPSAMSPSKRGRCLRWLDVLGKWSIIEQLIIIVVMVLSFIQIVLPNEENVAVDAQFFTFAETFRTRDWFLSSFSVLSCRCL